MTRVATQNNEEELLHMALQLTASQLERLVRGYRGVLNNLSDEDSSDRHSSRSMRTHYDDDGAVVIVIKLPPEQAELLMKAVDEEEHRLMLAERKRDPDESPLGRLARRADALVNLVESSTKVLRGSRSGSERNMVVVHVDEQTLSGGTEGVCETGSGSAITPATARRLSCDASVQKVTIDTNGRMVKVSSAQRTPPSWMRRQLRHRDVTCEFPGCDEERFLDAHHITHWADGGPTHLDNLIQLCWFHHHKVHDARWEVTREQDG